MATSSFFNSYNSTNEQSLLDSLLTEAIKIQGFDGYYILMEDDSPDLVYGDNPLRKFKDSYSIEMYLSNSTDPGLSNEFFTKFGLEIKNNTKVQISRRSFNDIVPVSIRDRPQEGDLIYIPWASGLGELYEIKFVNDTSDKYQLGRKMPYIYELELEAFKYSHEQIETGIEDIDVVNDEEAYSINLQMSQFAIDSGLYDGVYQSGEIVFQGSSLLTANCTAYVAFWDDSNNKLKVTNIVGEFVVNVPIVGSESETSFNLVSYDDLDNPTSRSEWDNVHIRSEETEILNTSESNPFGSLGG